jgi:hypothetical protein
LKVIRILLPAVVVLVGGPFFGWLLVAAVCWLPGFHRDLVCGHNSIYVLPIAMVFGVLAGIWAMKEWFAEDARQD